MRTVAVIAGLAWVVTLLSGCVNVREHVSPKMRRLGADAAPPSLEAEQALVIFMRPSVYGYEGQSSVFDLYPDGDQFIGIVSVLTKVAYPTLPGEHMFMVISENADFLRANLKPGKTYYVLVTPRFGWAKPRFSLAPVRKEQLGSAEFATWNQATEFIANTDESLEWAQENWASIEDKKVDYMRKWDAKPQAERDQQTLNPNDYQ